MLQLNMRRFHSLPCWGEQITALFLVLLCGLQEVSTATEFLYMEDRDSCNRAYFLDKDTDFWVGGRRGAGGQGAERLPCYIAFTASPEGGSKVCVAVRRLAFPNSNLRLHFYDGLGGGELPQPSKTLDQETVAGGRVEEEWCSQGGNATVWLEQRNAGVGSLQDLDLQLHVSHISSHLRHVFLDEHCEQTHLVDSSTIRVTSRQNNSETSAPGHCRQTFTLAPSADGERLMCLDFLDWPAPEKNCSYIHFYIYSGPHDSGKYDKYFNCSETPPNEWCVNNRSITIRLNRPPGGKVEPQNYLVMLNVLDRRLEGEMKPEEGSPLSTAGIVIIALCLATLVVLIIVFVIYNHLRRKNQPDEL